MNARKTVSTKKKVTLKKKAVAKKKVAVKKKIAPKKKVVARKKTVRKAPVKTTPPAVKAVTKRQTKSQIIVSLAEETGLEKRQVKSLFTALVRQLEAHLKPRGSGEFTIPETGIKVARITKPRTKARMGRNPATGETIKIAAKPARKAIRLTALKSLREKI